MTFSYYVAEQVCRAIEQLFDRGRRSRTDFLSNGNAPAEPSPHFGFAAPAIIWLFAAAAGSAHHTRTAALRACVLAPRRSRRLRAAWSFKRCRWRCRGRHVALIFFWLLAAHRFRVWYRGSWTTSQCAGDCCAPLGSWFVCVVATAVVAAGSLRKDARCMALGPAVPASPFVVVGCGARMLL